jgi:hypothetical protein
MKYLIYGTAFVFCFLHVTAQNIETTLDTYAKDYGQERMYLHYDKSAYVPGETIWFKDYLMKGMFPDDESKTAYVDWIGENGDILSHSVWPVENAAAFGQFEIPASYAGRFIHVKAYTGWMLNFNSAFLYDHDLKILSGQKGPQSTVIPELNFFPEGGDAIAGVMNKIAFKANDQYGRPVTIKGVIKDDKGAVIDSLRAQHDGMGYCLIYPSPGDSFSALWEDESGNPHITALPTIKATGVNLRVIISGSKRLFFVTAARSSSMKAVHILGTMYQQKIFQHDGTLNDGTAEGAIPTVSLPSGILTITVFDEKWNPLAERITYINNEDYLFQPEVQIVAKGLGKRAKNELQIVVPDDMFADLSVSVTDAKIESDNSDNIISHLLLTGELKGRVNDPVYYFLNNSDSVAQQLDLVMITHGWRRFDWEKVVQGKFPEIKYPKDTSYLSLSGLISGATPRQLKKVGYIILTVTQENSGMQSFAIPIAPNGYFNDPSLTFFGKAHITYDFADKNALSKVSVQVMPDFVPAFSNYFDPPSFAGNYFLDSSAIQYQLNVFHEGSAGSPGSASDEAKVTFAQIGNYGATKSDIKESDNNEVSGYTVSRQFYTPDYDTLAADDKKDLRTTLYWNPTVITSPEQKKVNLTFFNNDFTDEFRVIIEGITADGRLTHIEKIIK